MWIDELTMPPFEHSECRIKLAANDWELQQAQRLRKAVFVHEQRIFQVSDHDLFDSTAHTLIATTTLLGIPDAVVGTVRIHEQSPGIWTGSRLAVDRTFRHANGLGKGLIGMAVGTARAWGCKAFYANVQLQNVPLFQKLGWQALGQVSVEGVEHQFMQADLRQFAMAHNPSHGFVHLLNRQQSSNADRETA